MVADERLTALQKLAEHPADYVAFALRDLFETGVDLSNPSFRAFIRGYSEHYSLDEELISHLPTFMRLANLITYAKLVRAMDLANDQDYPEAYTSLLLKLENWIHNYKASLLSDKLLAE